MKCAELGDEQHEVLKELRRSGKSKKLSESPSSFLADRLQWSRSTVRTLLEELQDNSFVEWSEGRISVVHQCSCSLPPVERKQKRTTSPGVDPREAVLAASSKKLKRTHPRQWQPVTQKWTGYDLAQYFRGQSIRFFPGKDSPAAWGVLEKQFKDWMKIDEAIDPVLIKSMIDVFMRDPRNVDSRFPAWKSFLGSRKLLLRQVEKQSLYEFDSARVSEELDLALEEMQGY